jgi:hypothetical protein
MKRRLAAVAVLALAISTVGQTNIERRAFNEHEKYETNLDQYRRQWGTWFTETRWTNWKKQIPELPKTQNITRVVITKTSDSAEFVITITDVDGKSASFWCVGGGLGKELPVRSISNY